MQSKIKSILNRLNRRDLPVFPKIGINKYFKIGLIVFVLFSAVFISKTILAQDAESDTTSDTPPAEVVSSSSEPEIDMENITISNDTAADTFRDKQDAMEQGNNQESWMKESLGSNAMAGINVLAGTIPNSVLTGKNTTWVPGGLIGFGNQAIAMAYSIPISGQEYIAYVKNNFLGKPAYADSGYQGLSPIMNLWKGFRNATYILFSVIFVVIGVLIMLRVKVSPQAVITLQNAIPKLITSLILVTFSYAIVGLMIDLTYVVEGLGLSIIKNAAGSNSINQTVMETLNNPHIMNRLFALVPAGTLAIWSTIISLIIGVISGFILTPVGGVIVGGISLIVITLALLILIMVLTFKFLFGLLKCYVSIILRTIIAPFEIALGAIPNMKMGFNTWFIEILANLMVFPISMIILVLIKTIMNTVAGSTYTMWNPLGTKMLNVLTASYGSGGILAVAFGLGGLMLVSKLPKLIPEVIFQIKPSAFGKAMGETFAPIGGFVGKTASSAGRYGASKGGDWVGKNIGTYDPATNSYGAATSATEKAGNAFAKAASFFTKK